MIPHGRRGEVGLMDWRDEEIAFRLRLRALQILAGSLTGLWGWGRVLGHGWGGTPTSQADRIKLVSLATPRRAPAMRVSISRSPGGASASVERRHRWTANGGRRPRTQWAERQHRTPGGRRRKSRGPRSPRRRYQDTESRQRAASPRARTRSIAAMHQVRHQVRHQVMWSSVFAGARSPGVRSSSGWWLIAGRGGIGGDLPSRR
jgi:hypothetical protein